ncbi:Zinc finger GATA-type [Trinorchestia longiramus]|nr:Zinc finger GATA-type [Trinorchestia longiramus]
MGGLETLLRPSRFPPSGPGQSMVNPLSSFLRPGSPHDAFPPHNLAQLVSSGSSSSHWSRPSTHHALPLLPGAFSAHSVHGHPADKASVLSLSLLCLMHSCFPGTITGKNMGVVCSNCSTNNTRLWRRNPKGDIVCNACGLYFKLHNVDRPSHLFRDSPMTRRRNPRTAQRKRPYDQNLSNPTCSSSSSTEDALRLSPVTCEAGGSSNCVLSPRTISSPGPQSEDVLSAAYALSSIKSHRTALPQRDTPHHFEAASSRETAVKLEDHRGTFSLPERKLFAHPSNYSQAQPEPGDTVERPQSTEDCRDLMPRYAEDGAAIDGIEDLYDDAHATPLHLPDSREVESCPSPRPPPPPLLRLPEQRPLHRSSPDAEDSTVLVSPSLGPSLKA